MLLATTTATNNVLSLQSLTSLGTSAAGSAALTPLFNALGQAVKQHPAFKNAWLRWMLPLFALVLATVIVLGYIYLGYTVDPLTILGIYAMLVGASFGADLVYGALKGTAALPSGPNNHPDDQLAAAQIAATTPTNPPPAPPVISPPTSIVTTAPAHLVPSASTTVIGAPPPDTSQALPP